MRCREVRPESDGGGLGSPFLPGEGGFPPCCSRLLTNPIRGCLGSVVHSKHTESTCAAGARTHHHLQMEPKQFTAATFQQPTTSKGSDEPVNRSFSTLTSPSLPAQTNNKHGFPNSSAAQAASQLQLLTDLSKGAL